MFVAGHQSLQHRASPGRKRVGSRAGAIPGWLQAFLYCLMLSSWHIGLGGFEEKRALSQKKKGLSLDSFFGAAAVIVCRAFGNMDRLSSVYARRFVVFALTTPEDII